MTKLFAQALDLLVTGRIGLILVIVLAVSVALAGIAWFTLAKTRAAGLGYAAVPAGFIAGYVLFLGLPPFPSSDPLHLIPYVVLAGLLAGVVIDSIADVDAVRLGVVLGWPAFVIVAIGWREMPEFATFAGLPMAVLWLAAVLTHLWLGVAHRSPATPIVALFAVTVGLGLTAFIGGSRFLTVLSVILAVSFAGFLGWNYPRPRFPFGATANLGAAGAVLALAVAQVLYTDSSALAVATLMLVFALAPLTARLPLGASAKAGPFMLLIVCAIPIAAAAVFALNARG
jgi:hypothetical protein